MKKIIAIPLENGILCSHFGHCQQFSIIDAEDNSISGETLVTPPPHEPGLLPAWLAEKGVTDVIAGGMGMGAQQKFAQAGVDVFGYSGNVQKALDDFMNNTLGGLDACKDHGQGGSCH